MTVQVIIKLVVNNVFVLTVILLLMYRESQQNLSKPRTTRYTDQYDHSAIAVTSL